MAGYDAIQRTGFVLYPPYGRKRTHKLVFASESDARQAGADVQSVLADGSSRRLTGCDGLLGGRLEGATLLLDFVAKSLGASARYSPR
jgi:hypothetical protein